MDPVKLLVFNAGAQIAFSSLFGVLMLAPMQPWGETLRKKLPRKAVLSAHLDWLMLAFMQAVAGLGIVVFEAPVSALAAWLLVIGGWLNPVPYLFRAFGVDAFVLAGPPRRFAAAMLGVVSVLCILVAWAILLPAWWRAW